MNVNVLNFVSSFWSRLASSSLCELVELMGDMVPLPDIDLSRKDRVFNSWRTFWLFLGQVLSVSQTCREALRKAQVWIFLTINNIGTGTDTDTDTDTDTTNTTDGSSKKTERNKKKHLIQHFCLLSGP